MERLYVVWIESPDGELFAFEQPAQSAAEALDLARLRLTRERFLGFRPMVAHRDDEEIDYPGKCNPTWA